MTTMSLGFLKMAEIICSLRWIVEKSRQIKKKTVNNYKISKKNGRIEMTMIQTQEE
jgi:hypothetical protein